MSTTNIVAAATAAAVIPLTTKHKKKTELQSQHSRITLSTVHVRAPKQHKATQRNTATSQSCNNLPTFLLNGRHY